MQGHFIIHPSVTLVLVMLLVVFLRNSFGVDICKGEISEAEDPCLKGGINMSVGTINGLNFPCKIITTHRRFSSSSKDSLEALTELKASQCQTENTPVHLGLNFSWTINNTDRQNVTGLTIVVSYKDYQPFYHTLDVNLTTQQLDQLRAVTTFSTTCVPFKGIKNGHSYTVYAKVLPDKDEGFFAGPHINISIECDEVYVQLNSFCPAVPQLRPEATFHCNKTVSVMYTSEPPPGIMNRKRYSVKICLFHYKKNASAVPQCISQELNATVGKAYRPVARFENVKAGTYNAKFAFLDDSGLPCGSHYYSAKSNVNVEDPPEVELEMGGQSCDDTVSVNLSLSTPKSRGEGSVYNRGRLCLYQTNSPNKSLDSRLVSTTSNSFHTESFGRKMPGSFYVEFAFLDDSEQPCGTHYYSAKINVTEKACTTYPSKLVLTGFVAALIILTLVLIGCLLYKIKRRHDDDSVSGMVIVAGESSQYEEEGMDDIYPDRRTGTSIPQQLETRDCPYPDSGLPPSIYDVQSFHDGRSRVIAI